MLLHEQVDISASQVQPFTFISQIESLWAGEFDSPAEHAFRKRVRQTLCSLSAADCGSCSDLDPDPRWLYKHLAAANLLVPHLPRCYGGLDLDLRHMAILLEEMVDAGISENLYILSHFYAAKTILLGGDE